MTCLLLCVVVAGCAAPPAVAPLLRVAGRALQEEQAHLAADAQRDAAHFQQTRQTLAAAFEADLAARPAPDAAWVLEAVTVYTAAREALLRHEVDLERQRATRRDNLRAGLEAQKRAVQLLEKQDELIERALGVDLWRVEETWLPGEREARAVR